MPGDLIAPHGGQLMDCTLPAAEQEAAWTEAARRPQLLLDAWHAADVKLIATGAYSPLAGFMGQRDYQAVLREMHLENGLPWTLPITLPAPPDLAFRLPVGKCVALVTAPGEILATLQVQEIFHRNLITEAWAVYGTEDPAHPGVQRLLGESPACLAGPVTLIHRRPQPFPDLALDPATARQTFRDRGWSTVVGFQTRNPIHRAHEYIQKAALETVDGLFLHPLIGETKADDVPAAVRVESYRVLLAHYYPVTRVVLGSFPAAMRYAGPREAVFHALVRKNYGCSHFIVGRDHAGVGPWYGTYDAQRIFDRFDPAAIGIVPLCFEHTFYCRRCGGMASAKTCPHGEGEQVTLSGTRVRELLRRGELPPPEFSRPEVAEVLVESARERPRSQETPPSEQGLTPASRS